MRRTQYIGSFHLVTGTVHTVHSRDNVRAMHAKFWDPDAVGRAVRALVEATGMPGTDLARLAGVSPSQVSRWSQGRTRPRQEALVRLRRELDGRSAEIDALLVDLVRAAGYPLEPDVEHMTGLDDELDDDAEARHIRSLGLTEAETEMLLELRRSQIQQLRRVISSMKRKETGT